MSPIRPAIQHMKDKYGNTPLVGAEVGVQTGLHAESIILNLNLRELWLVDPYVPYVEDGKNWDASSYEKEAHERIDQRHMNVKWVKDPLQVQGQFNFIYIDGNHSYESVVSDLVRYSQLIVSGGVLCGHDFHNGFPGVDKAVIEFYQAKGYMLNAKGFDWWIDMPWAS